MSSNSVSGWLGDVAALTRRNILGLRRSPEVVMFSIMQPVLFVLMFNAVYGGAVAIQGGDYTNFLMAGIFAQTMVFSSLISGITMAEDISKGIVDRFRSLPMHPSAILVARSLADLLVGVCSIVGMLITGLIVGWRWNGGLGALLAGIGMLLLFAWALSWLMIALGTFLSGSQATQGAGMLIVMPLSFLSNAFVPIESFRGWLRVFVEWNPVSALVQCVRGLFGNLGTAPVPQVWPLLHPAPATIGYAVIAAALFGAAAQAAFRHRLSR